MALCQSPVSTAGPSGKHLSTPPTSLTDLCSRVEKLEDIFQDLIDKELPDGETSAASSGFAVRLYPMKTAKIRAVTLGSNFTARISCQVSFCRCKSSGLELVFSVVDLGFRAVDQLIGVKPSLKLCEQSIS